MCVSSGGELGGGRFETIIQPPGLATLISHHAGGLPPAAVLTLGCLASTSDGDVEQMR